jgi:putative ABC transport system permease protein
MDTLLTDLRQALRGLGRTPGFAAAAIGILALGIAANTAVFSVADAVLFRPLPYDHPEQLVLINEVLPELGHLYPRFPVNAKHFFEWKARTRSFADLAILNNGSVNLTGVDGPPERLGVERISFNLFPLLGIRPLLGRNFTATEDQPGNERVVILTEQLWRRRFHSDPGILNQKIVLNGVPHLVIGVLPSDFRFPRHDAISSFGSAALPVDLFKPIAFDQPRLNADGEYNYPVIGRLRAGTTPGRAQAELNAIQASLVRDLSLGNSVLRAEVTPMQERIVSGSRRGLLVLLASIGAVLLIVCVNLGNLMLARATARGREMAVRAALGAGSWRMVRQVLTESLAIAFAGGLSGLVVAYATVRVLVASAPVSVPRLDEVRLDFRALLFAFVVSAVAGLLFGIIPAWRAARSDPQEALRSGGRGATESRHGLRVSELLVSAEVALSAALLVAAGLLVGSLFRILAIDQGFHADNVLTVGLNLSSSKYREEKQRSEFVDRLIPTIQALPGVRTTGTVSALPLEGETWGDMISRDDDHRPVFQRPLANYRSVSPGYFAAMGIPILRGRDFQAADRDRDVEIISARAAARVWPGQDALGKHARRGSDSEPYSEVIGIAADTRTEMSGDPPLMVYRTYWKTHNSMATINQTLVIRTGQDPDSAAPAVRSAIWGIDAELPVPEMKTMRQVITASVSERRFQTMLLGGFALAALLLAVIGIYGVISYSVNRRRNEIGIRMALGAEARQVSGMVVRQGMRPVAIGLLIGLGAAVALGRLLGALLFATRPGDPLVLIGVAAALTVTAALACYLPARRATTVDPAAVLRYE